jgi:hypothetical protein
VRRALLAIALAGLAAPAAADGFTPARRAQFVEILSHHECRMHNFKPDKAILDELAAAGFSGDELYAIGSDLIATGDGVPQGDVLVLKIGPCSGTTPAGPAKRKESKP